jgi:hypothetical protein
MTRSLLTVVLLLLVPGLLAAFQDPVLPEGHPPVVPPGHPPVGTSPRPPSQPRRSAEPVAANPTDVASIDAIMGAYYDAISGPAGQSRDWDRFRSLFMPDARFVTSRSMGGHVIPVTMTIEDFIRMNGNYFERGGYFERELHRQTDSYGTISHIFSTYASRRREHDANPYSRGVNSIQLLNDGQRYWIVNVLWDYERRGENDIPDRFLGPAAVEGG